MGRFLPPVRVLPIDDAFQGQMRTIDFELWHFEAILDNGYSLLLGVMIYRLKKSGIVKTQLRLRKDSVADVVSHHTYLLSDIVLSEEFLLIEVGDKLHIMFDQDHYNKTGEWVFNISITEHHYTLNLKFIGTTTGWKTKTKYTSWAGILPKATVLGSLTQQGEKILLQGKGYHDHNWGQSLTMFLNKQGWFCGSVYADTLKITWAKEVQNRIDDGQLAIINRDTTISDDVTWFYPLPAKDIKFTIKSSTVKYRHRIPSEIHLKIQETTVDDALFASAELWMKIVDVQKIRFFTLQYYVCLVKTTGMVKVGSTEEYLQDSSQLIEFPDSIIKKNHSSELINLRRRNESSRVPRSY
jgi:hypothetical protein